MPKFNLKHFLQSPARKKLALMGVLSVALGSSLSWNPENTNIVRHVTPEFEETMLASTAPAIDVAADRKAPITIVEPISLAPPTRVEVSAAPALSSDERDELERLRAAKEKLNKEDLRREILAQLKEDGLLKGTKVSDLKSDKKTKTRYPKIKDECTKDESLNRSEQRHVLENLLSEVDSSKFDTAKIQLPVSSDYIKCVKERIEDEQEDCEDIMDDETEADFDEDDKEERKAYRALKKEKTACMNQVLRYKQNFLDKKIAVSRNVPNPLLDILKETVINRANEAAAGALDPQQSQYLFRQSIMNDVGTCDRSFQSANRVNCVVQSLWPQSGGIVTSRLTNPLLQVASRGSAPGTLPANGDFRARTNLPKFQGQFPTENIPSGKPGSGPGTVIDQGGTPFKPGTTSLPTSSVQKLNDEGRTVAPSGRTIARPAAPAAKASAGGVRTRN